MNTIVDTTALKQERINLRLHHAAKALLERAAGVEGKSVSSFILHSALTHAEHTIQTHERMRLNADDSRAFFEALNRPPSFNPALRAALAEHDQRVTSQ